MGAVIKLIPEFITISGATALYFPMAQWTKRHQEISLEKNGGSYHRETLTSNCDHFRGN
jgi:hypothetical protein